MNKIKLIGLFIALCLLSGCGTMNKAIESASKKNIAVGTDTWGGKIWVTMIGEESPLPSFGITFGRVKSWYISLKDEKSASILADAIKASNSSLGVNVSPKGASIVNE